MKNSIIENLISEVMMSISHTNSYLAFSVEKVREAQALAIMGRIEACELEARKIAVQMHSDNLKDLQDKLEALKALR